MKGSVFRDSYGLRTWAWVLLTILIVVTVIGLACVGGIALDRKSCERGGEIIGRQVHYDWWSGCFIRDDSGQFVPEDNWFRNEEVK